MKVCALLLTLVAAVAGEPPAGRAYLPPSPQYGSPSANDLSTQYAAPSAQYGLPAARGAPRGASVRVSSSVGAAPFSRGLAAGPRGRGLSMQYGAPPGLSTEYGVPGYNYGLQEDPLAEPANYQFSYSVEDANSLTDIGHEESRQDESAQGQYRVLLPDGRKQIVSYQADENGYRPTIEYEDTGITAYSAGGYSYGRGRAGAGSGGYHY